MSALKEEALLNGAGGLKTDSLKSILTNTINTIEDNKSQIFDIYETARAEVESSKQQLQELKKQAQQTIDRVDDLVKQEQREKQQLVQVSSNFQDYSEEKIRECYEQVKNVQVELGVQREKEQNLRQQRDRLELRLRHLQVMLVQAEHLALANKHHWVVQLRIPRPGRLADPVNYIQLREIEENYPDLRCVGM